MWTTAAYDLRWIATKYVKCDFKNKTNKYINISLNVINHILVVRHNTYERKARIKHMLFLSSMILLLLIRVKENIIKCCIWIHLFRIVFEHPSIDVASTNDYRARCTSLTTIRKLWEMLVESNLLFWKHLTSASESAV